MSLAPQPGQQSGKVALGAEGGSALGDAHGGRDAGEGLGSTHSTELKRGDGGNKLTAGRL